MLRIGPVHRLGLSAGVAAGLAMFSAAVMAQQPPPIGIAPVTVTTGPYTFDTAEQHKIRVVVVASGLSHPFSLAFLPNGDALVTERGGRLRLVRGATGASPRLEAQPVTGIPETPAFRTARLQVMGCPSHRPCEGEEHGRTGHGGQRPGAPGSDNGVSVNHHPG